MPSAKLVDDVVEADLRQDRDTVPLPLAVVGALVAHRLERQRRERIVGELGLLEAQHVGLHLGEPLLDPFQTGAQRVDVPGDERITSRTAPAGAVCRVPSCRRLALAGGSLAAAFFLAGAFFVAASSWPAPSSPAPSWPAPSWRGLLLGRRLLRRRLLFAGAFFAGGLLRPAARFAAGPRRRPSSPAASSSPASSSARDVRLAVGPRSRLPASWPDVSSRCASAVRRVAVWRGARRRRPRQSPARRSGRSGSPCAAGRRRCCDVGGEPTMTRSTSSPMLEHLASARRRGVVHQAQRDVDEHVADRAYAPCGRVALDGARDSCTDRVRSRRTRGTA